MQRAVINTGPPIVCFDLGGVLVQICHTWNEAATRCGIAPTNLTGNRPLNDCEALIQYQSGDLSEEAFSIATAEWLGVTPEEALLVHKAILKTDYPGALELVQKLRDAGIWTCCFSNTNALHWTVLTDPERHPAVASLNEQFASHGHQAAKPDPEAFRKIEAMFPPHEEVFFFDDTLENIFGAADAGWTAFRIDSSGDAPKQAREILKKLNLL